MKKCIIINLLYTQEGAKMKATALNNENYDALRDLLYIIQNNVYQEAERSLGQYRLQAFKTDYSATDFTKLIFNPILGLSSELSKQLSRRSSERWLKRAYELKKIYYSVHKVNWIDTCSISKKTLQISLQLIGSVNDTKPVIMVNIS